MVQINLVEVLRSGIGYHKVRLKSELMERLKDFGAKGFVECSGGVYSTNEFGIIEGLGFDQAGVFKVWQNTKFGTYEVDDMREKLESKELPSSSGPSGWSASSN